MRLDPPVGVTTFPLDLDLTPVNKFIYVVDSALGEIIGYQVGLNGKLAKIVTVIPTRHKSVSKGARSIKHA